jgi:carboxymethylenebutenolidase
MVSSTIAIQSLDGKQFDAYLSLPPTGRGPGLVMVQEIWGVNEHIRAVADQFAMDGYVVLAPDIFWRQEPNVDLMYDEAGTKKAYQLMQNLDGANAVADLRATVAALRKRPELDGKVAVVGYCMGGRLAYHLAASGAVDTAVCYYGGGIQNHLDLAPSITVPILFHYGALDAHIPASAVAAVKSAFDGRSQAQFYVYEGADHGFSCWGRPMYNQRASALARGRTLEWLSTQLA